MLPPVDQAFLTDRSIPHAIRAEGGMICVVFTGWRVPAGYTHEQVDLLLRLPPQYPDVPPDMWWVDPPLALTNGQPLEATQVTEHHLGRAWQRWSRHFNAGQWQPGVDSLESYVARIRQDMKRSASAPVSPS